MTQNNPTTILRCLLLSLSLLVSVALGQAPGELLAQPSTQQPSTFTPKSTFLAPAKLMDYWGDTPIPLSAYTEQELAMQRLLNAEEDALVTQNTRSEATLSAPPESEAYLAGLRPFEREPITPYTWKWVKLEMRRSAGNLLTVTLRRPHWWLIEQNAHQVGNQVALQMPELGAEGLAEVVAIWPNQLDTRLWEHPTDGPQVVSPIIGRFEHESQDVWDYVIDHGTAQPDTITATSNHLFWSVSQQRWREIGDFALGEALQPQDQGQATLIAKAPRPSSHRVYNFELYRNHNYFVGERGVWVHNACPLPTFGGKIDFDSFTRDNWVGYLGRLQNGVNDGIIDGITMKQANELRDRLRSHGIEFRDIEYDENWGWHFNAVPTRKKPGGKYHISITDYTGN